MLKPVEGGLNPGEGRWHTQLRGHCVKREDASIFDETGTVQASEANGRAKAVTHGNK